MPWCCVARSEIDIAAFDSHITDLAEVWIFSFQPRALVNFKVEFDAWATSVESVWECAASNMR
jgi:hypothetical protein